METETRMIVVELGWEKERREPEVGQTYEGCGWELLSVPVQSTDLQPLDVEGEDQDSDRLVEHREPGKHLARRGAKVSIGRGVMFLGRASRRLVESGLTSFSSSNVYIVPLFLNLKISA